MIRTLAIAAAAAAILTPVAAHATPHEGCTQTFDHYSLDVCAGTFTFPSHKGPQWLIITGPSMSGSEYGPTWLPQAGGTISVHLSHCSGQVDVRSTKARTGPKSHIAGRQWVNTTGTCAPKPTPTPTPTRSTPSTPPTSTSTTSHPSPSSSSSSHATRSGGSGSSSKKPSASTPNASTAPLTTSSVSSSAPELARTGGFSWPLLLAALVLSIFGIWVRAFGTRKGGAHR